MMKKHVLIIIAAVLAVVLLGLTALLVVPMLANRTVVEENYETTTTEYTTTDEYTTTEIATTVQLPPPVTINGVVWRVAPTLELGHVRNCCGVFVNPMNMRIDSITGEVGEWGCGDHGGGGGSDRWIDPDQRIIGHGRESHSYDGMDWVNFNETNTWLADGLFLARRVDFSLFVEENFRGDQGNFGLPAEAFGEPWALVHNATLVTDFIFDNPGWDRDLGIIAVQQGEQWGILNYIGAIVIPLQFQNIVLIDQHTAFARHNGRYGILDITATAANF
ncbi:MAG: hypothetical protein FWE40_01470 [Oscillospiraceae bacterium]|nr:hypothetical protein [Oscillospiraceae bacterium]